MDYALQNVAACLDQEKESVMENLLEKAAENLDLELPQEDLKHHRQLLLSLIGLVSNSLIGRIENNNKHFVYDIENYFFKKGILHTDMIALLCDFRITMLKEIRDRCLSEEMETEKIYEVYDKVVIIFDMVMRNTTKRFNENLQSSIQAREMEILELTAPIVPIKKGVAVLPLIGDFSESRATYITNTVIPKVSQMEIDLLIIDFSGIHIFDTFVAQHFFQIRDILKLLGIEPVITGIRPALAQTAIQLGINIDDLRTYTNVQQVLERLH
ncbi:STAS domain-containing protein [Peribacillus glennii]|uniref:STAS domain-containing protein n=1 Tax=Peribacillus glennii TaxID=2303991 RepID=A0A372L7K9_9BACI|nr:STAS domain-containing protein [Peribacillus glennii]RFU61244.1 STAS domain-containing protein [Peribacillus glennii]